MQLNLYLHGNPTIINKIISWQAEAVLPSKRDRKKVQIKIDWGRFHKNSLGFALMR